MKHSVAPVLVCLAAVGCGDSFTPDGVSEDGVSDTFTIEAVSGTYNLKSINGEAPPIVENFGGGDSFTVESATLRLNESGTFLFSLSWSQVSSGVTSSGTDTESGTFTLTEPSTINFTWEDGDTASGTIDGNTLTVTDDGETFVFQK